MEKYTEKRIFVCNKLAEWDAWLASLLPREAESVERPRVLVREQIEEPAEVHVC